MVSNPPPSLRLSARCSGEWHCSATIQGMLCKLAKIKDLFLFTRPFDLTGSVKKTIRKEQFERTCHVSWDKWVPYLWLDFSCEVGLSRALSRVLYKWAIFNSYVNVYQRVRYNKTVPFKYWVSNRNRKTKHDKTSLITSLKTLDTTQKKHYFELSPPWHLYVLLLANLLAFYLTYLLAFYLAYLLALYLAYLLTYVDLRMPWFGSYNAGTNQTYSRYGA